MTFTGLEDFIRGRQDRPWWRPRFRCLICRKPTWTQWGSVRHVQGRRHRKALADFDAKVQRVRSGYRKMQPGR